MSPLETDSLLSSCCWLAINRNGGVSHHHRQLCHFCISHIRRVGVGGGHCCCCGCCRYWTITIIINISVGNVTIKVREGIDHVAIGTGAMVVSSWLVPVLIPQCSVCCQISADPGQNCWIKAGQRHGWDDTLNMRGGAGGTTASY